MYLLVYPVHRGSIGGPKWSCGKAKCVWQRCWAGRPKPGRPAYHCGILSCRFVNHGPEHIIKPTQGCFMQKSQVKTERLEPSQVGPNSMINQRIKTRTDLRSNVQLIINVTEQRRPETCQSQAGRPLTVSVEAKQLPPTSGRNQERPREGGGRSEKLPGRPA